MTTLTMKKQQWLQKHIETKHKAHADQPGNAIMPPYAGFLLWECESMRPADLCGTDGAGIVVCPPRTPY